MQGYLKSELSSKDADPIVAALVKEMLNQENEKFISSLLNNREIMFNVPTKKKGQL